MTARPLQLLVNIDVAELTPAVAFYQAAFGLQVGRRFGAGAVELLGASSAIYLLQKPAGSAATDAGASPLRSYQRHWTPVHLDFVVGDADAAVRQALAAGATLEQPVASQPYGRLALLADPFGNGFCFVQFTDRGYDEIAADSMP